MQKTAHLGVCHEIHWLVETDHVTECEIKEQGRERDLNMRRREQMSFVDCCIKPLRHRHSIPSFVLNWQSLALCLGCCQSSCHKHTGIGQSKIWMQVCKALGSSILQACSKSQEMTGDLNQQLILILSLVCKNLAGKGWCSTDTWKRTDTHQCQPVPTSASACDHISCISI